MKLNQTYSLDVSLMTAVVKLKSYNALKSVNMFEEISKQDYNDEHVSS